MGADSPIPSCSFASIDVAAEEAEPRGKESEYIANAENWTQSKSTAGNPDANAEEFAEFDGGGALRSKNKAEEQGAKERVELPSVAKGTGTSETKSDIEGFGTPEAE